MSEPDLRLTLDFHIRLRCHLHKRVIPLLRHGDQSLVKKYPSEKNLHEDDGGDGGDDDSGRRRRCRHPMNTSKDWR